MSGEREGSIASMISSDAWDVIILGSGVAGLAAALAAHELDLRPLVLEKASRLGGGTVSSYGLIWAGQNHAAAVFMSSVALPIIITASPPVLTPSGAPSRSTSFRGSILATGANASHCPMMCPVS
jgi:hypothetical protein